MLDDRVVLNKKGDSINKDYSGNYFYVRKVDYPLTLILTTKKGVERITIKTGSRIRNKHFERFILVNDLNDVINLVEFTTSFSDGINEEFQETSIQIENTVNTQQALGRGTLYKTIDMMGYQKILDYDPSRIFFSIQNQSEDMTQIGGVDVKKASIRISANATYSDKYAPSQPVWGIGFGRLAIATKHSTPQFIYTQEVLFFNDNHLNFNGHHVIFY